MESTLFSTLTVTEEASLSGGKKPKKPTTPTPTSSNNVVSIISAPVNQTALNIATITGDVDKSKLAQNAQNFNSQAFIVGIATKQLKGENKCRDTINRVFTEAKGLKQTNLLQQYSLRSGKTLALLLIAVIIALRLFLPYTFVEQSS